MFKFGYSNRMSCSLPDLSSSVDTVRSPVSMGMISGSSRTQHCLRTYLKAILKWFDDKSRLDNRRDRERPWSKNKLKLQKFRYIRIITAINNFTYLRCLDTDYCLYWLRRNKYVYILMYCNIHESHTYTHLIKYFYFACNIVYIC